MLPFVSDHLWANLVAGVCEDAPRSVHLAGLPEPVGAETGILEEVETVRRIVELGRQARSQAGLKLRQPLSRLVAQGASLPDEHLGEIGDELRVKAVELGAVEADEVRVKPNLPVLGPKLGSALADVRRELAEGRFELLPDGAVRVAGRELGPDEVLVEHGARPGWAIAAQDGLVVGLATGLDAELLREGRVNDLTHAVNVLRKEQGLELTDRISLTIPESDRDLLVYEEQIKAETLALRVELGDSLRVGPA
jgi:isoleucyl-tRNA synthetase